MIGEAIGKSVTTVRKYVAELEERGLITTERTLVVAKDGRKRNGRLRYHILPIQMSIDQFNERQIRRLEETVEQMRVRKKLGGAARNTLRERLRALVCDSSIEGRITSPGGSTQTRRFTRDEGKAAG